MEKEKEKLLNYCATCKNEYEKAKIVFNKLYNELDEYKEKHKSNKDIVDKIDDLKFQIYTSLYSKKRDLDDITYADCLYNEYLTDLDKLIARYSEKVKTIVEINK